MPLRSACCSLLVLLSLLVPAARAADSVPLYTNPSAPVEERVKDLLGRMTVEEKVGQLVQYSSRDDMTGPATQAEIAPLIQAGGVGSLLNVKGAAETRKWQQLAVNSTRLHIPLLFGLDVIHGYRTIFPIPLATAASWDLGLIEQAERAAAVEASSAGVHWTFAPMVDIARDPRWGRIMEGSGEDTYLGSAIARARVRGFQTARLGSTPDSIMACAKHFAAYGAAQAGRDYFTTDVTERVLRDVYLPPFQAAADEGAFTFMAAFNDIDGTPCSSNDFLMNKVLRAEWGFKGFVVSDWASIAETLNHGNAADLKSAARRSFLAGLDMDMESQAYEKYLAGMVKDGSVPAARLDAAAGAILAAKFRLGLFDDPYRYCDEKREKAEVLSRAHLDLARDAARRSCVLLQNNGCLLPLRTTDLTVALVGPLADASLDQMGGWAGEGRPEDTVTLRTALAQVYPGRHLRYAAGCATVGADRNGFAQAREAAKGADVVVLALGEAQFQSGETTSRSSLDLSGPQLDLIKEVHAAGKPIVLVLMAGRPLMLEQVAPLVDAIVMAWHPGTMGGPALADVLTGAYNPSGKLPVTWPRSVGQIPIFYASKHSGRPAPRFDGDVFYTRYIDSPNTPLYPFGFGLSYTSFEVDNLRLSSPVLKPAGDTLTVTARVRNIGKVAGEEVVQLYVRDRVGSLTRPVRELKGFRKVALAAGEEKDVTFPLTPKDLGFWRGDMTFGAEPGAFDVYVGTDATAKLSAPFTLAEK
jgi:beta-glucosidase